MVEGEPDHRAPLTGSQPVSEPRLSRGEDGRPSPLLNPLVWHPGGLRTPPRPSLRGSVADLRLVTPLPLASCLLLIASCLLPLAPCLLPLASCLLPLATSPSPPPPPSPPLPLPAFPRRDLGRHVLRWATPPSPSLSCLLRAQLPLATSALLLRALGLPPWHPLGPPLWSAASRIAPPSCAPALISATSASRPPTRPTPIVRRGCSSSSPAPATLGTASPHSLPPREPR